MKLPSLRRKKAEPAPDPIIQLTNRIATLETENAKRVLEIGRAYNKAVDTEAKALAEIQALRARLAGEIGRSVVRDKAVNSLLLSIAQLINASDVKTTADEFDIRKYNPARATAQDLARLRDYTVSLAGFDGINTHATAAEERGTE